MAAAVDKALGKRIAGLRKAADLTQAQLAEKVGVAVETISRLERGSAIPSLARVDQVGRVLGVDLHELFAATRESAAWLALRHQLRGRAEEDILLVSDVAQRMLAHLDRDRSRRR